MITNESDFYYFRNVMVLMESLAGTGHKLIKIRPKASEKLEFLHRDPWGKQLFKGN